MPQNPFFIQPADSSELMGGLGKMLRGINEKRVARQDERMRKDILDEVYGQPQAMDSQPTQEPTLESTTRYILHPDTAASEREAIHEIGLDTPEKQEDALSFAEKFGKSKDDELLSVIKDRISKGVADGRDMSHTASLINKTPEEARAQVTQVSDLLKNEKFRRMYAKDPKAAQQFAQGLLDEAQSKQRETDLQRKIAMIDQWKNMPEGPEKDALGRIIDAIPAGMTVEEKLRLAGGESDIKLDQKRTEQNILLETQPEIERRISESKESGKQAGEAKALQSQMESSMPAMREVVDNLRALSGKATYTMTGKAYNAVARELGFATPPGATARASYIAIVDNEVLPLLRQTFGSAFTEREGASLKAVLGDPDKTPAEKQAQLDAFIAAKERQVRSLGRQTGSSPPDATPPVPARTVVRTGVHNGRKVVQYSDGTTEYAD